MRLATGQIAPKDAERPSRREIITEGRLFFFILFFFTFPLGIHVVCESVANIDHRIQRAYRATKSTLLYHDVARR